MEQCPYWRPEDHLAARDAPSFRALGAVLYRILLRMPHGPGHTIHQICGPITSGGLRDVEKNSLLMRHAVAYLRLKGHLVLDQTPLRPHVSRLYERWKHSVPGKSYCWEILHEIYLPIIKTGFVRTFHFLPGWEGSLGARWEYQTVLARGYEARAFPHHVYKQLLERLSLTE